MPSDMDERQPLLHSTESPVVEEQENRKEFLVVFDPNGDPDNPMEWPKAYRWGIVLLLAFMAFTVTFTCIGIVPVASQVVVDLEGHKDKSASVLFVTIWELGEAAGPLFIAPLSEMYGRYPVLNATNALFMIGILITALSQDSKALIFARFLTGCAVQSNVLNPAIIGDVFPSKSRGSAMSAVFVAPLLGGAFGPAFAGLIADATGWREVMWVALGLAGLCELAFLTLFRETYKVTILRRRAARLRNETGNPDLRTEFDTEDSSGARTIAQSMLRPAQIIYSSFVLQALSLFGALIFGYYYVMCTTYPDMLQDVYGLNAALTGLAFMSFSVGSICGIIVCNLFVDRLYVTLQQRHKGTFFPEGRLPLSILGGFTLPLFLTLYGWIPQLRWSVWLLVVSVILMGFSVIVAIVPLMTYVTDAFGVYSASAITAVLITRCLAGTFLPLLTAPLTRAFGYGYGFLILAAICMALAPVPPLVMRYGLRWRQRSSYTKDVDE